MNNNDGQHNKTVTFPRKSIVKATVFIVVLFISAAILDLLGYLDFVGFNITLHSWFIFNINRSS